MFVATSNSMNIPGPLLDRMEVIRIPGYTENEKESIADRYLMPKQLKNNGLTDKDIKFNKNIFLEIIRSYTREAGVRNLEREISKVARKVVKKVVSGEKKEVIVPLVKEVVDAKPIEVKPATRKQASETIKLEVIRVRPDGSLVIAGKGLPNSKVEIISGAQIIAETNSDKIGDFVAVPEKQLKGGEYLLSFRQTTQDGKVVIANKSVAINVTGAIKDIPIVAIVDSEGKLGAKVVQAPGLNANKEISKDRETIIKEDKRDPYIAILAITHDTKVGQIVLSGRAHNGAQINAGFSGKETSSTKIVND